MHDPTPVGSYYTPSLRVPPLSVPITVLCSAGSLPAAWLYAWCNSSLPSDRLLFVHFFTTFGYACWLAMLAWSATSLAKVRNPRRMGWLGLLIGVVGWYFQWAAHVTYTLAPAEAPVGTMFGTFSAVATQPLRMLGLATGPASTEIGDHPVLASLRLLSWLTELLLMTGLPCLAGSGRACDPFCEKSNAWAAQNPVPYLFACSAAPAEVSQRLGADPERIFSILTAAVDDDMSNFWKATLFHCRGGDLYVTVRSVKNPKFTGPRTSRLPSFLTENLRLPDAKVDDVMRKFAQAAQHIPTPPELHSAVEALESGRFLKALEAAEPHVSATRFSMRTDALRISGLANARLERWADSRQCYIALYSEIPTARNALEVATSSVMAGEIEWGEKWVAKAIEINSAEPTVPGMGILTAYMTALTQSGHMKLAMPYLEELKKCYEGFGITDSHFLWTRRVPFFEVFLEKSAVIIRAVLNPEQAQAWYASMLPHLDESGRAQVTEWIAGFAAETTS